MGRVNSRFMGAFHACMTIIDIDIRELLAGSRKGAGVPGVSLLLRWEGLCQVSAEQQHLSYPDSQPSKRSCLHFFASLGIMQSKFLPYLGCLPCTCTNVCITVLLLEPARRVCHDTLVIFSLKTVIIIMLTTWVESCAPKCVPRSVKYFNHVFTENMKNNVCECELQHLYSYPSF